MSAPTTVARLLCDEPTARRLATFFSECLDPENTACAAFEGDDGRWQLAIHFRDAPNEASLRFRFEASDCLFNINRQPLLGTKAERVVNRELALPPGATRYQLLVLCMPAMPAKPR